MNRRTNSTLLQKLSVLSLLVGISTCLSAPEQLPYYESFETGKGAWSDASGFDFNWTRNSGATPTPNTGPSTAHEGNYYLYTEANNNFPTNEAGLRASFDLSTANQPTLSFFYHMYGEYNGQSQIGTLAIDRYNATARNWEEIWSLSGQQQSSNSAAWVEASIDLTPYAGPSSIALRFRGITGSDQTYGLNSDIAIDRISVLDLAPPAFPYYESFEAGMGDWVPSAQMEINWEQHSLGTRSENTGPSIASSGSIYLYLEASGDNYPAKTAAIEANIDLSPLAVPQLKFDYHMFGDHMGSLYVDVYNGTWHTNIWSISGEHQATNSSNWQTATIDLSPYGSPNNASIRIRGITGKNYRSDMAIDNIVISEGSTATQSYLNWLSTQNVPANQTDYYDDPAGDGIANIWKYATGQYALQSIHTTDIYTYGIDDQSGNFYFRYKKSKRTQGTTLQVQWSTDLNSNNWQTAGMVHTKINETPTLETWEASVAETNRCFIRLYLEKN